MGLLTTTIGSYPQPKYVPLNSWFQSNMDPSESIIKYNEFLKNNDNRTESLLRRAIREVIRDQVELGIDVLTDGEIRRENYIHYHCRHLNGIDFYNLSERSMRDEAYKTKLPTITKKITTKDHFLAKDWEIAQSFTDRPVKMTIPGPMTIADTLTNQYYTNDQSLVEDIANAINWEIKALAKARCKYIQVDEPVFAREPEKAIAYGIDNLDRCFHEIPKEVVREVHTCCGYPEKLDQDDYKKADPSAYFRIAPALEESTIQVVSIEDAHRHNNLELLELYKTTSVILGVVAIAQTRIESIEEIEARLADALYHIDEDRLIAGPDCGLGMLKRNTAKAKLKNLVSAARSI